MKLHHFPPQSEPAHRTEESGQVLVIAAMMLMVLAITLLFYLSLQRALSLANFLDETAEMMSQAALRPKTDISGNIAIDDAEALNAATAALEVSLLNNGELSETQRDALRNNFSSEANGNDITLYPALSDECRDKLGLASSTDCLFPAVEIQLALQHTLFNIPFTISTSAVSTLGDNAQTIDTGSRPAITVPEAPPIGSETFSP